MPSTRTGSRMNDANHKEERAIAVQLVKQVREGSPSAEADMVQRYSRGLRFLLRRKTRDTEQAEDFLQETWGIALARIRERGLDDPGRLAGFLCGIANRLVMAERRREQRQQTYANSELVALVPDASSGPFGSVSRAELCRYVRTLLDQLSQPRDREILNRFYVLEEDKAQICADLDVDGAHFNRVLYRARQRLKAAALASERRSQFKVVN